LGGAEGKAPISLKQTELSLKQFAKRMGQPNFSAFNKWKEVWVAGFLEKKHWSVIPGQNHLKSMHNGSPHWEMAVAIFWKLSRPGYRWKISMMSNGLGDNECRCF
jgi:hypothetical protein